ncbi:MAG: tRNA threonylcarbamoyladenosine dehydratase [Thermoguttaceae bacterium]|nr:tRNA threonylcarbamoyladenosine dehydratase [Thermoguttaceae bacterium]
MKEQFRRTALMIGESGLAALHKSCVTVVGLGAVGSYAVEALARAGIGRFRLVDFDRVQPSNINRQPLATHMTVGALKTELARERIAAINPDATVETKAILVNDAAIGELFEGDWSEPADYVVDAIDSLGPKVTLVAELVRRRARFMSSMGAALRFDASLVQVGKLSNVVNCPLARQLRKRLRRVEIDPDLVKCVYSPEPIRDALRAGNEVFERVDPAAPLTPENVDNPPGRPRNTLGSLPTVVGIFGLRVAHEAILELSGVVR